MSSLPQRWNNQQLAWQLVTLFQPYGNLLTVKASRDGHGRPYGFIEYHDGLAVERVMERVRVQGPIWLDGRQLRVELSQTQRRLCLRLCHERLSEELAFFETLKLGNGCRVKMMPGEDPTRQLTIMVRMMGGVEQPASWLAALTDRPGWTLHWSDEGRAAMIRHSGMVQINLTPPSMGEMDMAPTPPMGEMDMAPTPPMGEMNLAPTPPMGEMDMAPTEVSTNGGLLTRWEQKDYVEGGGVPRHAANRCLFVGRLHPQRVTIDSLYTHFYPYGTIQRIRLAKPSSSVLAPIDAHAFILFGEEGACQQAIEVLHGSVFLGHTIKVEQARR